MEIQGHTIQNGEPSPTNPVEIVNKPIANHDVTFCTDKKCKNRCWRYIENFKFKDDENYWFIATCENTDCIKPFKKERNNANKI